MKVLVVGKGGREHALAWKIAQSFYVDKLFCFPGNAGIASVAEIPDIKDDSVESPERGGCLVVRIAACVGR